MCDWQAPRATFIKHTWDFYRPIGWADNAPQYKGGEADAQYDEALLWCHKEYRRSQGLDGILDQFQHVLFHCNAPYHSKRNLRLITEAERGKTSREDHNDLYTKLVEPGTQISALNGTTYTCPLYACILSLLATKGQAAVGERVLCFSYDLH